MQRGDKNINDVLRCGPAHSLACNFLYFFCTIYRVPFNLAFIHISSLVMIINKMHLKPFILLCFLFAVIVIAAVVADEPPREERKGRNLSKLYFRFLRVHIIFSSIN